MLAGVSGIRVAHTPRLAKLGRLVVGEVDDETLWARFHSIAGADAPVPDRASAMAIIAAHEALNDAGVRPGDLDGERIGLIMGKCQTEFTGTRSFDESTLPRTRRPNGSRRISGYMARR